MDTRTITAARLSESVVAVPPLARRDDYSLDVAENKRIVEFIESGGVNTLLYGGNAVLYHVRLSEYEQLLSMLTEIAGPETLMVPSVGPAFGTMMDQAEVLRDFDFPTAMILPQREIADAVGLANGIERFASAYGKPVVLYLKHDRWLPPKTVAKLVEDGLISWIKYAVVLDDPKQDDYLREVLDLVPSELVVSGIGEQPAIVHLRDFKIGCFTSGCVCVNPAKSMDMLRAIQAKDYDQAEVIRKQFLGLEDLRNGINPIRVLHRAVSAAGIANTGPMYPMLGELTSDEESRVATAAKDLKELA